MNKAILFLKNNKQYIFIIIGFILCILLTATIIYLNKTVFTKENIKLIPSLDNVKIVVNNIIGISDGIVVFSTFVLLLNSR